MFYTNESTITKTFHGVTFRPGETKEVFGNINDPKMALSSAHKEPPTCVRSTSSESAEVSEATTKKRGPKPKVVESPSETSSDSENPENSDHKEVL